MHGEFDAEISRTALLNGISIATLGNTANLFLSILVSLACFTTAVGIVTGTADFMKYKFGDSQRAYALTAILGCVLGVVMGQFNVHYIIAVAVPALMFIYPITIILILLNVLPGKYVPSVVFKAVIVTTILFSIPDFLGSIGVGETITSVKEFIPLSTYSMGWVLPAGAVLVLVNTWVNFKNKI
jgi:LIVCS family branched-chain amino acid:cation transporter